MFSTQQTTGPKQEDLMKIIIQIFNNHAGRATNLFFFPQKTCLNEGFCRNGGRCLMDSCEPEGYRCECDSLHYGKKCEQEISMYTLEY